MTFRVLNSMGDTVLEYDVTVEEQRQTAQREFEQLIAHGYMAIGTDQQGERFITGYYDETAKEYLFGPRLVGG